VQIPTKISDVNKAAELLGKRYGIFTDKVNMDISIPVVIHDDLGEDDE
jgi:phage terminase small subunit